MALDVVVFSEVTGTGALRDFLAKGVRDKPVATARMEPEVGEEVPIMLIVGSDAMEKLAAERDRGGEIEIMLARFVQEVLHATLGASIDDAIYASKVRDLLVRFLGR